PRAHVGGATDHLEGGAGTGVDRAEGEAVSVRVPLDVLDPRHDDILDLAAEAAEFIDRRTVAREPVSLFLGGRLQAGDARLEPSIADMHSRTSGKLIEGAEIRIVEVTDVRDPVSQHGDAGGPHPEGEAGVAIGVVADGFEDRR